MTEGRGWRRADCVPALGQGVSKPFALVGQALGSGCPLTFTWQTNSLTATTEAFQHRALRPWASESERKRPEFSRSWWAQVFAFLIRSPGSSKYIGLGESLYILEHGGDSLVAKTKWLNYCLHLWAWVKSDSLKSLLRSLPGSNGCLYLGLSKWAFSQGSHMSQFTGTLLVT